MKTPRLDRALAILSLVIVLLLLTSLLVEVIYTKIPCLLCQLQRGVYMVLLACLPLDTEKKKRNLWLWVTITLLLVGLCLAVYHTLLQFGLISSFCVRPFRSIESKRDVLSMLTSPSCEGRIRGPCYQDPLS